jgi:hypothetical protein
MMTKAPARPLDRVIKPKLRGKIDDKALAAMNNTGASRHEMAQRFNVTVYAIDRNLRRIGYKAWPDREAIQKAAGNCRRKITDQELRERHRLGHSAAQVADQFKMSKEQVRVRWERMGLIKRAAMPGPALSEPERWPEVIAVLAKAERNLTPTTPGNLTARLRITSYDISKSVDVALSRLEMAGLVRSGDGDLWHLTDAGWQEAGGRPIWM